MNIPRIPNLSGLKFSEKLRIILPASLMLISIASVPYLAFSDDGLPRLHRLEEEKVELVQEKQRMTQSIETLRAELERVKNDPRAVERVARDELGLVRQTEVVMQFED